MCPRWWSTWVALVLTWLATVHLARHARSGASRRDVGLRRGQSAEGRPLARRRPRARIVTGAWRRHLPGTRSPRCASNCVPIPVATRPEAGIRGTTIAACDMIAAAVRYGFAAIFGRRRSTSSERGSAGRPGPRRILELRPVPRCSGPRGRLPPRTRRRGSSAPDSSRPEPSTALRRQPAGDRVWRLMPNRVTVMGSVTISGGTPRAGMPVAAKLPAWRRSRGAGWRPICAKPGDLTPGRHAQCPAGLGLVEQAVDLVPVNTESRRCRRRALEHPAPGDDGRAELPHFVKEDRMVPVLDVEVVILDERGKPVGADSASRAVECHGFLVVWKQAAIAARQRCSRSLCSCSSGRDVDLHPAGHGSRSRAARENGGRQVVDPGPGGVAVAGTG